MAWFNYKGKLFEDGEPVIGPGNRGLRYGDGLFETIKLIKGRLIFEDEHFARLWKGMKVLQFDFPKHFTPYKLFEEILVLAKKNGHHDAARVRITVLRSNGSLFETEDNFPNYIIQTWHLSGNNGNLNINGLDIGFYNDAKKSCDVLCNLKHNNYLPYVMAAMHAKKEKWNDAVLLNTAGRICDSTIANIFIVKNEVVYTPSLIEGCVAGVMRKHMIDQLKKIKISCVEKEITTDELLDADEIFLTNSISNMQWVKNIGDKELVNTFTRKIYAQLVPTFL